MTTRRMHDDEVPASPGLVRRLLASQFPRWAELPVRPVAHSGTDNAIFRLGDSLAVRMPRRPSAAGQPAKEHRWLPVLAPSLPLAIPAPIALGTPGNGYPFHWTVCPWLPGANPEGASIASAGSTAASLAAFVAALQATDTSEAPLPGEHNFSRGVALRERDSATRRALGALAGELDTGAALDAWRAALAAPEWDGPPAWIHGDIAPGNLLAADGRITAVIDFGGLAAGDPACDLQVAWNFLRRAARDDFRAALRMDDASWTRGRGWALSVALIQLPYYASTNPALAANSRATIAEVLGDFAHHG